MVGLIHLALVIQTGRAISPAPDYTKAWSGFLSKVCRKVNRGMLYDLDVSKMVPPPSLLSKNGSELLFVLSASNSRDWKQVDGLQVFVRDKVTEDGKIRKPSQTRGFEWIRSLSADKQKDLAEGRLSLGDVSNDMKKMFYDFANGDPNMMEAFLNAGGNVGVSVTLSPKFTYVDPKTGVVKHGSFTVKEKPLPIPINKTSQEMHENLEVEREGPLDFGEGAVLTLQEIVNRAGTIFQAYYRVDARIAKHHYFVSGKHTKDVFDKAIALATKVPEVAPVSLAKKHIDDMSLMLGNGLHSLIDGKVTLSVGNSSSDMDGSLFGDQSTNSIAQLSQINPMMGDYLKSLGLDINTQITIIPGVSLNFDAGGEHVSTLGTIGSINGVPVPAYSPNRLSLLVE